MPYWAELWPSGLALARALRDGMYMGRHVHAHAHRCVGLEGASVVELGCGLGVPSLVAASCRADVTALDWAPEAINLLQRNAVHNGLELTALCADWRTFDGAFDLVLGADLLYEQRNADALLELLPRLGPDVLLAEPGRPSAASFFEHARELWLVEELTERIYRLTARTRADRPAPPGA
jgi:predicted nicotinamide N-methyase